MRTRPNNSILRKRREVDIALERKQDFQRWLVDPSGQEDDSFPPRSWTVMGSGWFGFSRDGRRPRRPRRVAYFRLMEFLAWQVLLPGYERRKLQL